MSLDLHAHNPNLSPSIDPALLRSFLAEDLPTGDLTSEATIPEGKQAQAYLLAKQNMTLAGCEVFAAVFRLLDAEAEIIFNAHDGNPIEAGAIPIRVKARARALLAGERTALNLMQRMSGIATLTARYVQAVHNTGAAILDTRKTMPGLRALDKYSVLAGGGKNHRISLSHAVLIKENHIRVAGGVRAALEGAAGLRHRAAWIEVEVTNHAELAEALQHRPDVILLDNMQPHEIASSVAFARAHEGDHRTLLEASGGITLATVRAYAEAGVDWISIGALTHSAPSVDLSFLIETDA